MASVITFFLLFILPFVIAPFGVTQFEDPKVIFAEGGVLLLLLARLFTKGQTNSVSKIVLWIFSIVFLLTIVDILFLKTEISIFGNVFRLQGIFLLWLLLLFSYLSSTVFLQRIPYYIYTFILFVESISLFFLPLNESQRYVGTLGEPNAVAAFSIFVLPFVFFSIKKFGKMEILFTAISLILVGSIIYFSGSKSAAIALFIEILFVTLYKMKISLKKCIAICMGLYLLSYTLPFFQYVPYENRTEIWKAALGAGNSRPYIGWGFGNIEYALHASATKTGLAIQYYYVDSAHNIFFDWYVAGGIVGFTSILILVAIAFLKFFNKKDIRSLTLFLGMITVLSFNPASVVGLLGFWWILGQGVFQE